MAASTTEAVLLHHGKAVNSGNMNMILEDYTEASVLYIPTGTYRGLDGIKRLDLQRSHPHGCSHQPPTG